MSKLQHKVERAEPSVEERRSKSRSDMTGLMAQLVDLAQTTHEQTKKMPEYMKKSKEWLISRNWSFASYHMEQAVDNLTYLQDNLELSHSEGGLVKFLDLLWLQNNYELPITRMDCLIDRMSEEIIDDYVERGPSKT